MSIPKLAVLQAMENKGAEMMKDHPFALHQPAERYDERHPTYRTIRDRLRANMSIIAFADDAALANYIRDQEDLIERGLSGL